MKLVIRVPETTTRVIALAPGEAFLPALRNKEWIGTGGLHEGGSYEQSLSNRNGTLHIKVRLTGITDNDRAAFDALEGALLYVGIWVNNQLVWPREGVPAAALTLIHSWLERVLGPDTELTAQ